MVILRITTLLHSEIDCVMEPVLRIHVSLAGDTIFDSSQRQHQYIVIESPHWRRTGEPYRALGIRLGRDSIAARMCS
jgi:hypothetical protein